MCSLQAQFAGCACLTPIHSEPKHVAHNQPLALGHPPAPAGTRCTSIARSPCSTLSQWQCTMQCRLRLTFLCPCAGYGDNLNIMNSIHLLQQYVEKQNKLWLSMEMDNGRGVDLADVEDPRVDLCLFCIQSHRLRPIDLR